MRKKVQPMDRLQPQRWRHHANKLGLSAADAIFNQLDDRYREPHRAYHNARHINECLARLDAAYHPNAEDPLVEYALWFHDAVYDVPASDNEERSANWACEVLRGQGIDVAEIKWVYSLIMATRHPAVATAPAAQLLVDIDLAILGADPPRYAEFERDIRIEYRMISAEQYVRGRCLILQGFLDREHIYSTAEFRARFEQQARLNLSEAIARIGGASGDR